LSFCIFSADSGKTWAMELSLPENQQKYVYHPLPGPRWIRILELQPSTTYDDPLHCKIIDADRDRWPVYDACSYVWGTPNFSRPLYTEGSSYIRITPVVEKMLWRLRSQTKIRKLWIDAICLHQQNDWEKAEQIPMMGEIFRQAAKVRIWLGDYESQTRSQFIFFSRLADFIRPPTANEVKQAAIRVFGVGEIPAVNNFFNDFFHIPWFHR